MDSNVELRFGKDYQEHFDTKAYLNDYLSGVSAEIVDYNHFIFRNFHDAWSKMPKKNLRILEFGGGPKICDLISAEPYTEEIIFAEYSEKNRRAVEAWQQKSPDAHDWSPHFRFVVEYLEGKGSEEVCIREAELRKKVTHILPCDIGWEDPVKWPSSWPSQSAMFDVVTTSLCLEAAVTSAEGYRHAIVKLRRYLKPGGFVLMFGVLGESFYMVGQEKFYCFPLSKDMIEETLVKEGFQVLDLKLLTLDNMEPSCDAQAMFFLRAGIQN
ncbi:hypothetical protein OS493_027927 [Desmophyllum pertusum]|uniref:Nicotinamide N-methyltransferase-like n=1 Tax=Desmophyllum pertusum TaxID=174260 RepID=A0A9X0CKX8_9CNID|nr:hypothetical protein OS493_027927 [Desmophyllum pertusum]